jgi:hypothetical protein
MNSHDDVEGARCWAWSIGGCDGCISREHLISCCLFDDELVIVRGFRWCLEEPKTIGLSGLVAKILCRKHNSHLSGLDETALDTFDAFRESVRLNKVRTGLRAKSWRNKLFVIDGARLERWFLKTLINLSVGSEWIVGPGVHPEGMPSEHLVKVAFGMEQFEEGAGLYIAGLTGEKIDSMDGVHVTPRTHGPNLVGGAFTFRGYRFHLNLLPERLRMDGQSHLLYRDSKMVFRVPNSVGRRLLSHEIRYKW